MADESISKGEKPTLIAAKRGEPLYLRSKKTTDPTWRSKVIADYVSRGYKVNVMDDMNGKPRGRSGKRKRQGSKR